jgi:uncharacterized protein (DUF4415 family)
VREEKMRKATGRKSPKQFRTIARPHIYTEHDIALANVKVDLHIRLDADIVRYFKEKAAREGGKYQSLLNQHLRDTLWSKPDLEHRVQRIEERLGLHSPDAT